MNDTEKVKAISEVMAKFDADVGYSVNEVFDDIHKILDDKEKDFFNDNLDEEVSS